jgi:hypothetical protein
LNTSVHYRGGDREALYPHNEEALERLRENFYHLWKALCEAREDPTRLVEWKNAPRGSQEWRKAIFFE